MRDFAAGQLFCEVFEMPMAPHADESARYDLVCRK